MNTPDKTYNESTSSTSENKLILLFSKIDSLKTIEDYEKAIRIWNNILNTFASITQQTAPKINNTTTFTTLEQQIVISLSENLLHAIIEAYTSLLELKTNQNRLQNAITQIEQIIGNCEYFIEFTNEKYEQIKSKYVIDITNWLMLNYFCGEPEDFDLHYEKLLIAIEQLYSYIQKNGEINFTYSNTELSNIIDKDEQLRCA